MFDLTEELKKFDVHRENAVALAVIGYVQANLSKQRYLRKKYVAHLETVYPNTVKLEDIEGHFDGELAPDAWQCRADYADEERDRTRNISNHDRTEDMRLDDPRHGEKG